MVRSLTGKPFDHAQGLYVHDWGKLKVKQCLIDR